VQRAIRKFIRNRLQHGSPVHLVTVGTKGSRYFSDGHVADQPSRLVADFGLLDRLSGRLKRNTQLQEVACRVGPNRKPGCMVLERVVTFVNLDGNTRPVQRQGNGQSTHPTTDDNTPLDIIHCRFFPLVGSWLEILVAIVCTKLAIE
jgi:hypothetical protein